ncbi:TraG/VirB4 family ATPase [Paenibacillus elgii]|uniref:TraG/VirB4 family ATPase n=1 Tax=Paenibacillus elgii TaxID=189691 RepID=UPI0013D48D03|nr:DUF87 domain-containing protein [Paenibacillus elgii]
MLNAAKRLVKRWRKEKQHLVVNPILEGKDEKNGHCVRVIMIKRYTPIILTGYLDQLDILLKKEGVMLRKTIRYMPSDVQWSQSMKYKLRRLKKNLSTETDEDPGRKAEKEAYNTILQLRDSELDAERKLTDIWTFLTISAPKIHMLDAATQKLRTWFDHMGGKLDELRREQLEAMRQTSPAYDPNTSDGNFFNKRHYGIVTTDVAAARTYPMTRGSFSEDKGMYIGRRSEDGSFRFVNLCDPSDSRAQNITVVGKSGEGKSFFMKALVVSLLEEGIYVFVFDLDGEWRDLCAEVGGVYIDHTADNGRYFEPLTIMPALPEVDLDCIEYNRGRLKQAMQSCIRTYSLLADGLTKDELYEVGESIRRVQAVAGILRHDQSTWEGPYAGPKPTIHRVFEDLGKQEEPAAKSVYDKVKIYFTGIYDDIFQEEEPNTFHKAPLVVYKVGVGTTEGNEKDERAKQAQLKMSMAFEHVNSNIQFLKFQGVTFSAVLVDEGQRQLKNPELKLAVFAWYTAIRKWNGMMILGSNTPAVMLESTEGIGMWENTNIRVYFFLEASAVRSLTSHSDVPIEIQEKIAQNAGSHRFILEYHKHYDELFMDVPPEEAALYKTRGLRAG